MGGAAVKALSLTQPWAQVILHHGKRIENRVKWRGCSYRGPILLHAAQGVGNILDFDDTVEALLCPPLSIHEDLIEDVIAVRATYLDDLVWRPHPKLPRGGIVGRARIDGVIHSERDMAVYEANVPGGAGQRKWWFGGFALVLADVEPLPFVPWKGALGLFEVPNEKLRDAARCADWERVLGP